MESEVAALKLAFSINNEWFEWSTVVVLAGLVFELVTLLIFHKTASWREKSILIAGTLFIAIGVAGEWHFGSKASAAASRLQAISDQKVATLAKDAASAKKDAANAIARAAKLEEEAAAFGKQIADANARVSEAQAALVKAKAPRTLGVPRQQFIADAIRPFAGQRYWVAISPAADDGPAFWESLYATLKGAGWVYVPPAGPPTVGNPPAGIPIAAAPGVEIVFDPTKETQLIPSALALGNALHADGTAVAVNRDIQSSQNEADRDILLIRIGARVPPQ
jgi:hypothetical protein